MDRLRGSSVSEQALIWATALLLACVGAAALQRRVPGPFVEARAQLAVEARDLRWTATRARNALLNVNAEAFSIDDLSRRLDAENEAIARSLNQPVVIKRDDLLERTNAGLH
jgi:hypothetical protein